jgi:ribonucleoside-diphosphate reductase alpha chain
MTSRERLPNRRNQESFVIEHGRNRLFHVSIGRYDDGRFAEVFISCNKVATESDLLARDAATIISIACQHGVPLDALRGALCRTEDGIAESFIGAALDAINLDLADDPKGAA